VKSTDLNRGEIVLYRTDDGKTALDVRLEDETVWLTLNQMAHLFGRDKSVVSRHLGNIFRSRELPRQTVVAKYATTAADGKTYQVDYYSLDAIISVGYRVKSKRGTQFRISATQTLRDHLVRGYTLHERRLRERGVAELEQAVQLLSRTLRCDPRYEGSHGARIDPFTRLHPTCRANQRTVLPAHFGGGR
jgi:DNA ligase (NAD+)